MLCLYTEDTGVLLLGFAVARLCCAKAVFVRKSGKSGKCGKSGKNPAAAHREWKGTQA